MKVRFLCLIGITALLPPTGWTQTARVLPWQPPDEDHGKLVYHPEPILFVHGINSNDEGWEHYRLLPILPWNPSVLPQLESSLQPYYLPEAAAALILDDNTSGGRYRATQRSYLHTFNYGDRLTEDRLNVRAFQHIEWNALAEARSDLSIVNNYSADTPTGRPPAIESPPAENLH